MESLPQTHDYLLNCSIKPSLQRAAVMGFLLKNKEIHPTVDDIYVALSPKIPTLSKTTVYNTLKLFVEKGAVNVLTIDERNARYDIDTSKHAHCMCRCCGKVFDFFDVKPELFQAPESEYFKIESTEISYVGVCLDCGQKH